MAPVSAPTVSGAGSNTRADMSATEARLTNGGNGGDRDAHGRFTRGNSGGPGNPHVKSVAAWRSALARVVSPADIKAVLAVLLECAKAGEPWAVKELLDRCLGKPRQDAGRPEDGPEQPGILHLNVDLGALMAQRMVALSAQPPAPGLRPLPPLIRAPLTRQRTSQSVLRHLRAENQRRRRKTSPSPPRASSERS
jgi:hypothetical protein